MPKTLEAHLFILIPEAESLLVSAGSSSYRRALARSLELEKMSLLHKGLLCLFLKHLLEKWELCSLHSVFPNKMLRYKFSTLWNKALKSNLSAVVVSTCQVLATSIWHIPGPTITPLQLAETPPKAGLLSLTLIPISVGKSLEDLLKDCFISCILFERDKRFVIGQYTTSHTYVTQGTSLTPRGLCEILSSSKVQDVALKHRT